MKQWILHLIFILISLHGFSQKDSSYTNYRIGISGYYGPSILKNDIEPIRCEKHETFFKSSMKFESFFEYQPIKWLSLHSGIGYNYFSSRRRNYCNSIGGSTFYPINTPNTRVFFDTQYTVMLHSIIFPLSIQFHIKKFTLSFGAQSNIIIKGRMLFQDRVPHINRDELYDWDGYYHNQFIWGGIANISYAITSRFHVNFEFYHSFKSINEVGSSPFATHNEWLQQYQLGLTYLIMNR